MTETLDRVFLDEKADKKLKKENRRAVREYWHSFLEDCGIMGWLLLDGSTGEIWAEYEASGQSYKALDGDIVCIHSFNNSFYELMPKHVTLKSFIEDIFEEHAAGYLD